MNLFRTRHRRLATAGLAVAAAVLIACGADTTDDDDPTEPAGPASTGEQSAPAADQDEAAAGDCAAYVDSDAWCEDGIGDYDCEGGQGDGPNYAPRGVEVAEPGVDPFGLDRDDDGQGCEAAAPEPEPEPEPETDPRFDTCGDAIAAGYGPYHRGQDPEYDWYRDADSDGVVCER